MLPVFNEYYSFSLCPTIWNTISLFYFDVFFAVGWFEEKSKRYLVLVRKPKCLCFDIIKSSLAWLNDSTHMSRSILNQRNRATGLMLRAPHSLRENSSNWFLQIRPFRCWCFEAFPNSRASRIVAVWKQPRAVLIFNSKYS